MLFIYSCFLSPEQLYDLSFFEVIEGGWKKKRVHARRLPRDVDGKISIMLIGNDTELSK
jgi:hypothetical protein